VKITIISNNIKNREPELGEEVEQRLTITSDGRVYLRRYGYTGHYRDHDSIDKEYYRLKDIDRDLMNAIFKKIINNYEVSFGEIIGIGTWKMEIIDDDYEVYTSYGVMEGYNFIGIDMTVLMSRLIGIDHLFLFGSKDIGG